MTTFTASSCSLGLRTRLASAAGSFSARSIFRGSGFQSPGSMPGGSFGKVSSDRAMYRGVPSSGSVERTERLPASVTTRAPRRITAESWQNSSAMSAPHSPGSM